MAQKVIPAVVHREPTWWVIELPSLDIATQARTLREVRAMATEAAALQLDVEDSEICIELEIILPTDVAELWQRAQGLERESRRISAEAAQLSRRVVRELRESGISQRDSAEALGLSPQRIAQLEKRTA
ncbi:hypothetical protein M3A96_01775 [Helcobacillus massiliensis]|uniref:Putative RNase H-like HicB family nuclease n=1 Tax=Helcobacillus massiliensis TaxID=521392 RepID=A0A839QY01_9MICO|nr:MULTISPECIES: hypothetical protein [Helcobacillus]MBB3023720.1 putative RNase H-like HicB family nuclease [Helcobacillus massiliensis]MCG7427240.1 hypothetical protein [Helcobacillus sp. ACRRO]MCT1556856.1 hypothetical protein [Helcobacillus massiliensis]MCT2035680.1 hypothetical protein [Helcobacillus massiliensis]MCT2330868.1 hypothetical protein [Helcobacillus massiliensis]